MTAFHSMMLLSCGAPLMPAGGSCCNRLKSRINLFLDGVDMMYGAPPRGPPAAPRRQGPEAPERARNGCGDAKACPVCAIRSARVCENSNNDEGGGEGRGCGGWWSVEHSTKRTLASLMASACRAWPRPASITVGRRPRTDAY